MLISSIGVLGCTSTGNAVEPQDAGRPRLDAQKRATDALPGSELGDRQAPTVSTPLIDNRRWEGVTPKDDPFADRRHDAVACDPTAHAVEQLADQFVLEVRTDLCDFLTLQQPSLAGIEKGDVVELTLWHNRLAVGEPRKAFAAVAMDGELLWQQALEIPADANTYTPSWQALRTIPQGSTIVFHIDNHGINSWKLSEINRTVRDGNPL